MFQRDKVFIHRSIAQNIIARMVEKTARLKWVIRRMMLILGLISEQHLGKVMGMISKGVEGAQLAVGGQRVRPQILKMAILLNRLF